MHSNVRRRKLAAIVGFGASLAHSLLVVRHRKRFIPSADDFKPGTIQVSRFSHKMESKLPIQIFRGSAVKPCPRLPPIDLDSLQDNANITDSSRFLLKKLSRTDERSRRALQMKIAAETRALQPLNPEQHLRILYVDEHICVVAKPSGVLTVPGPRRNPSISNLVYDLINPPLDIDQMVVHRIDMDTSGVVVFALNKHSLRQLHDDFRERRVKKTYQALVAGHIQVPQVEVDVALERDPYHAPFMRIAQAREDTDGIPAGYLKFLNEPPKPSLTELLVESREYCADKFPVTRVSLTPHTGRTHQLRVHCAALGFPILGDDIYGLNGEGDCGVAESSLCNRAPDWLEVQEGLDQLNLPLCLHAKSLCLNHPCSGAPMVFECEPYF